MTRAFKKIIELNIIEALKYNYFSVIVFIFLIILNIFLIYDIIKNKKETNKFISLIGRYYKIIFLNLLILMIINNIKKI